MEKLITGLIQQLRNLNFILSTVSFNRVKQGSDLIRYLFSEMVWEVIAVKIMVY